MSVGIIFGEADLTIPKSAAARAKKSGYLNGHHASPLRNGGAGVGGGGGGGVGTDFEADRHIGMALLTLLLERRKWLQMRFESDVRVRGIMTKSHMLLSDEPLTSPQQACEAMAGASDFDLFADHIQVEGLGLVFGFGLLRLKG